MSLFGVRPEKEKALMERMQKAGLREQDFDEKFIRSGGPGGQKVNRSATCVWLRHRPSGLDVKVQRERSQGLNRFLARRLLLEKFEEKILGISARDEVGDKIRKQKNRRKRRTRSKKGESSA